MFQGDMSSIAQLVFHELAHQKLYRKNDSAFNEAFASTIGEQGTQLWLKERYPNKQKAYAEYLQKKWQFFNLILATRNELGALYKMKKSTNEMKQGKQNILQQLKTKYTKLKKSWGGDKRYDAWFNKHPINNAKLAVIGVYYQKVPEFNQQLKAFHYDFETFYNYYESKKDLEK
jgi:predicted aminopeptidase